MNYTLRQTLNRGIQFSVGPRFRIPELPGHSLPPRVFTSTYFDTPDYRLARVGMMLRRRVEYKRGLWQLELPRGQARLDLEVPGNSFAPPKPLMDCLFGLLHKRDVLAIAKLRTRRSGMRVQNMEGPLADVVFDRVTVLNNGKSIGYFSEIDIEPLKRNGKELSRIAAIIREAGAQEGDPHPKVFKALGLRFPQTFEQVLPAAPPIDHLRMMLQRQLTEILIHDPGTRFGKDPEELHNMRVGTRRFRALLRAARPLLAHDWAEALRAEISWLGESLGTVRDFDVLLEYLHTECNLLPKAERAVFVRVLAILETQRSIARTTLVEALQSDRYLQLLDRLESATQKPEVANLQEVSLFDLAAKEFKKLRRALENGSSELSDQNLHQLRIQTKRARYTTELAETVIGKPASRFITQCKKIQDLLGEHQDAVVTEERLRKLLGATRGVKTAFAMGQMVERLHSRRQRVRRDFPKEWAKLKRRGRNAFLHSRSSTS